MNEYLFQIVSRVYEVSGFLCDSSAILHFGECIDGEFGDSPVHEKTNPTLCYAQTLSCLSLIQVVFSHKRDQFVHQSASDLETIYLLWISSQIVKNAYAFWRDVSNFFFHGFIPPDNLSHVLPPSR